MEKFNVVTKKREVLVDITSQVQQMISSSSISSGLCVLYCPHTTAALTINEGADPDVAKDIVKGLAKLVPQDWPFAHMEGNSDAHLKASMIGPSLTVLIEEGKLVLGTWQRIYFCEFDGPRSRTAFLKLVDFP